MISFSFLLVLFIFNCVLGETSFSSRYYNYYDNYCNRKYPNGTVPPSPNSMHDYTFYKQGCFCDEECWKYGDCCEDASPLMTSENPNTSVNIHKCEKIAGIYYNVYVVNTCPSTWIDDNTRSLCLKEVKSENYHYMLDVPVYSDNTRNFYANTYCSICNNDRLNASFLKLNLTCNTAFNCKDEFVANSSYIPGKLRWIMPNKVQLTASFEDPRFNKVRKCHKVVNKCANNWTNDSVSDLCENYGYKKLECLGTLYKNIHCAKCNYENIDSFGCDIYTERAFAPTQPGHRGPMFNWLLDFKMSPNTQQCSDLVEIYDEFLHACVPKICGKNYDLIDGKCHLKLEFRNTSDNNSRYSCSKINLAKNEFHVFSNLSIYRNKTETIYNESEYEEFDNDTYLVCIGDDNFGNFGIRQFSLLESRLSTACLSISLVCLAAHIIIHCVMNKHSKLPGKTLLSLSISLFIGQLLYFVGIYRTDNENVCFTIGVFIHFFYLSVFFWMNVMAIDICRTLSRSHRRIWNNKIFYYYSVYAWLCPLLIVIVSVTIDLVNPTSNIRPRYGRDVCWISDRFALFLFFALPIGVILAANFVLYFVTTYNVYKTVKINSGLIKSHVQRRFHIYVKLALVLGLTWIVGFAAASTDFEPLWYGFIILNASQGSFIFIVFTLKRKVLRQLCQKLAGKTRSSTSSSRRTESTSLKLLSGNTVNGDNDEVKIMLKDSSHRSI